MTASHRGKAALERCIRRAGQPSLLQHPQAASLADRLDDPRQHQLSEHLIAAAGLVKAQHPVSMLQGIGQAAHPRGGDRQEPASRSLVQAQVKLALPRGQPLPRRGLQQLQFRVIVSRAQVLDLPRPPVRGVHNLHRGGTRRRLHRPHIRHPATLRPRILRNSSSRKPRTSRSPLRVSSEPRIVSQLRSD
jgi:hypothetical protein